METIPESQLVEQAKKGDEGAFTKLLDNNLPKIKTSIQKKYTALTPHDLNDVVQIATTKAWQRLASFAETSSFMTWLYVIVRNETLNFIKKKNVIDIHELPAHHIFNGHEDSDYEHLYGYTLDDAMAESAAVILQKRESLKAYKEVLDKVLNKLKPSHSQIIKLVVEEDKSYKEISDLLNIPIGTVMSRLYFARRHAQKLLKQYAKQSDLQLPCVGRY